jgi:hypothetical protein
MNGEFTSTINVEYFPELGKTEPLCSCISNEIVFTPTYVISKPKEEFVFEAHTNDVLTSTDISTITGSYTMPIFSLETISSEFSGVYSFDPEKEIVLTLLD